MEQTFTMDGAPPVKSTGTSINTLVMGGRYLLSKITSNFMGGYEGMGIDGYDKVRKEYVSTWIDSMGTGVMVSRGKKLEDGRIEYRSGPQLDPATGKEVAFRMTTEWKSDDEQLFEMFATPAGAPEDQEAKIMTIVFTRQK